MDEHGDVEKTLVPHNDDVACKVRHREADDLSLVIWIEVATLHAHEKEMVAAQGSDGAAMPRRYQPIS